MNSLLLMAALVGGPSTSPAHGCYGGAYGFHGCYGGGPNNVGYVNAAIKDGDLHLNVFVLKVVAETRTATRKEKNEDGTVRDVPYQYTAMKFVPVVEKQVLKTEKLQGFDSEGNKVALKELSARLENSTPVLVSYNAQPVDPAYFTMLKKGALVLVLPKVEYGSPKPMPDGPKKVPPSSPKQDDTVAFADDDDPPPQVKDAKGPKGPAPSLASASIDDKGMINIQNSSGGSEPTKMKVAVEEDGVTREVEIIVKNTFFNVNKRSLEAKWVKAHDLAGKEIDAQALAQQLKKHTNVLTALDGKKVDPYYLQHYKEGTIVLMPPAQSYYGSPPAVPTPAETVPLPKTKLPLPGKEKLPDPNGKFPPPPKELPKTSSAPTSALPTHALAVSAAPTIGANRDRILTAAQ